MGYLDIARQVKVELKVDEPERFAPVKIYSRLLNDTLWLVWGEKEMEQLIEAGVREPIYVANEILTLKNKTKEELRKVHLVKKVFPGAVTKA
jgi:hypothetical protein